jgi:hypothetical protein
MWGIGGSRYTSGRRDGAREPERERERIGELLRGGKRRREREGEGEIRRERDN